MKKKTKANKGKTNIYIMAFGFPLASEHHSLKKNLPHQKPPIWNTIVKN
jgi:hypothetical protein